MDRTPIFLRLRWRKLTWFVRTTPNFAEPTGRILFHHRTHGCMSHSRGTRPSPNHSKNRITWRNLVFSDEDFARQYFQVIYGKQFINPNDYGTFDD
jgi:hypothetical protein